MTVIRQITETFSKLRAAMGSFDIGSTIRTDILSSFAVLSVIVPFFMAACGQSSPDRQEKVDQVENQLLPEVDGCNKRLDETRKMADDAKEAEAGHDLAVSTLGSESGDKSITDEAKDIRRLRDAVAKLPIYAPIKHQPYYRGERELYGYDPDYSPGVVSFGPDNQPYIIAPDDKPIIQTLDADGNWIELDFGAAIRQKFPEWNGVLSTGAFGQARIYFAQDGDAYLLAATGRSNIGKLLLLHSRDQCRSWMVYPLPFKEFGRLEVNDTFNVTRHPPAITFFNIPGRRSEMWLITPEKNEDGTLSLTEPVLVSDKSANVVPHSGDGNFTVSIGDNVHVVWLSTEGDGGRGQRHFAATYDRLARKMSEPVFVGRSNEFGEPGGEVDNHCLPVITVDQDGYLHAILGTHHHPFSYTRSLSPDSVQGWLAPEIIGVPKKDMDKGRQGSYTYPSINCDPDGNIHTIARWAGRGYYFCLVHLERSARENCWMPQNDLVVPFRPFYATWYHKVSIDRDGNLVVYYINYQNQMDEATLAEYNRRWPEDGAEDGGDPPERLSNRWMKNIGAKNPAILMRRAGEKRWFLARTDDFIPEKRK